MSMNFHIYAEREIYIPKLDKHEKQLTYFDCWQTPTKVSYRLEEAPDPIGEYKNWTHTISVPVPCEIYDPEDIFGEGEPRIEIRNPAEEHCQDLDKWMEDKISQGYDIVTEVY